MPALFAATVWWNLNLAYFLLTTLAGACPSCDGLGVQQFFDPERVIQNTEISLAGGAIRGWDRRTFYYFQMLMSLAEHYKFDVEAPYDTLSPPFKKLFYMVQAKKRLSLNTVMTVATSLCAGTFEGVLNNMERRYKETESTAVREELAKYISNRPCVSAMGRAYVKRRALYLLKIRHCLKSQITALATQWNFSKT